MKQIHPLSLVLGLAIAVVCMLTMSQVAVQPGQVNQFTPPCTMQVEYGPHARDMVQISSSAPYTVPAGMVLVVTALGLNRAEYAGVHSATLFVDGIEALVGPVPGAAAIPSMTAIPMGLSVQQARTVTVVPSHPAFAAQAWGFLTDNHDTSSHGIFRCRVRCDPHPSDMITITGGAPMSVPPGRIFVLTALARTSDSVAGTVGLKVDGAFVCNAPNRNGITQTAFHEIATGLTARSGSTLEVDPPLAGFQAWGYLADE